MSIKKTNAARLLDNMNIPYDLKEYPVDENDLSAEAISSKIGLDVHQVFKTLVLRGNTNGIFVIVLPGDCEVNLKKAAKVSGNKSAAMVHMKELLGLTGYIRGGCSPLGMKKEYPVFIQKSCLDFDSIYVSGGKRGLQLLLKPNDLIRAAKCEVCDIIE